MQLWLIQNRPNRSSTAQNITLTHALVTFSTWRLLILSQAREQLTETLLSGTSRTALGTLAGNVNDLRDALPAGATRRGVLAVLEELFGVLASLVNGLLLLVVVVLIEFVNVLLRLLDRLGALLCKLLGPLGVLLIPLLPPLLNDLGFLLLLCVGTET